MATRIKTDLMRKAEEGLGGPLEETLQDALNARGNAAALAKELGVAKGNVDYWIRKHGLELVGTYRRADQEVVLVPKSDAVAAAAAAVADDDDATLRDWDLWQRIGGDKDGIDDDAETDGRPRRVADLSPTERALIDAIRAADVAIDDLVDETEAANLISAALKLAAQGVPAAKIEQMTRSDVQMISHLKAVGAQRSDLLGLTPETLDCLREIDDKGLRLEDYAKFDMKHLLELQKSMRRWQQRGISQEQLAELTPSDLDLLDAARKAGWNSPSEMHRDLALLDEVREAGLDDAPTIEAVKRLREPATLRLQTLGDD